MVVPIYSDSVLHEPVLSTELDGSHSNTFDQRQRNMEDVEIAVKNIERCMVLDDSFPELADKLKIRQGTALSSPKVLLQQYHLHIIFSM